MVLRLTDLRLLVMKWETKSLLILLFLSCSKSKDESMLNTLDFQGLVGGKFELSDLSGKIEVIPLEIPDSIVLGKIHSIRYTEPYWIMHDPDFAQSVYLFDESGMFVNRLQRIGEGPGAMLLS